MAGKRFDVKLKPSKYSFYLKLWFTSMMDKKCQVLFFSPSEMEVVKNHVFLKTRYKIPDKLFFKDSRIVMQPYLMNYTRKTQKAYTLLYTTV